MKQLELSKYESACYELVFKFIEKYYCSDQISFDEVDRYWVGDEVGGVVGINDEFWDMNDIATAFRLNVSVEKLFEWYYYSIESYPKGHSRMNLKSFLKRK